MGKKMDERKLILRIIKIMPDDTTLAYDESFHMTEAERLDLLLDLPVREAELLIAFCARIATAAADGMRIKMEQLQERYADDLSNK